MKRPPCRRSECRRYRISPQTRAVIIAADRLMDNAPFAGYEGRGGLELRRLQEAVTALRDAEQKP